MEFTTTNVSELIISINVIGDITFKIDKFNPKMIYHSSNENIVLFVPNVPITMDTLIKSNVGVKKERYRPSDFINVFSSPILLNQVIQYIKKNTNIKPVSISEAERKGYIKSNIELILSIYFDNENFISIINRNYPIHSYNWDGAYKATKTTKNVVNYTINIDLYVLSDKKSGTISERTLLTCDMKRRNIAIDLKGLGLDVTIPNIGAYEIPSYGPSVRRPYTRNNKYRKGIYGLNTYLTNRGGRKQIKKSLKSKKHSSLKNKKKSRKQIKI